MSKEIVTVAERASVITSHSIGVAEMLTLLETVPSDAEPADYELAVVRDNLLGFDTEAGREKRFKSLRQLYGFDRNTQLFRTLVDLWSDDRDAQPLLVGLHALARDSLFRLTATPVLHTSPGQEVSSHGLLAPVVKRFPDAYGPTTQNNIRWMAHKSWTETGHLVLGGGRTRLRSRAVAKPANMAFALLLGHLSGLRGDDLFSTVYAKALDLPTAHLPDLAFEASRRGMIEYRSAGGVTDVGFKELLRPLPTEVGS